MKTQADICLKRHGMTNPTTITVKCPCEGCVGNLRLDGTNKIGSLGFLHCTECGCCHCIETTKDSDVKVAAF